MTDADAGAIAGICTRLDGLPLAIELAAARVKILPARALLARLEGADGYTPLRVLAGGAPDLPDRLRTMRGAIAWSYDLLDPDAQTLFRRLSVFVGGCTLEAAEEVCGADDGSVMDILDGLTHLVELSLLRSDEQPDGEARFTMLETIREYGLERLAASGEEHALRGRHAAYYLCLAERAVPAMNGPMQSDWVDRLEQEHDNLRAALRWSLDAGDHATGCRLAAALWRLWLLHGHLEEGRRWIDEALRPGGKGAAPMTEALRAHLLRGAGTLALYQQDYDRATAMMEGALTLYHALGDRAGAAASLSVLGSMALRTGDYRRATALHEEGLALQQMLGNAYGVSQQTVNLGLVAMAQGDYGRAIALLEEGLALQRSLQDPWMIGLAMQNLGLALYRQGDDERAASVLEEGLALQRARGDRQTAARSLVTLGHVAYRQGNPGKAGALYRKGLEQARDLGDRYLMAYGLEGLAAVATAEGHPADAARLFGAAEALREDIRAPLEPGERGIIYDPTVEATRAALGEQVFAGAWMSGRMLPEAEAVALALDSVAEGS